jgi:hypothetical protein
MEHQIVNVPLHEALRGVAEYEIKDLLIWH